MALIEKGNTNPNIETKIKKDLTSRITRTKREVKIKTGITRVNTGTKTGTSIDIASALRIKINMKARIKTRRKRVPLLARTRNTKVVAPLAKIRTRAKTRNITTNRAPVPRTKTGERRQGGLKHSVCMCVMDI